MRTPGGFKCRGPVRGVVSLGTEWLGRHLPPQHQSYVSWDPNELSSRTQELSYQKDSSEMSPLTWPWLKKT